ncbi:MAG: antibiotic biosynthesis monooxygenase [Sphingomonadales bacterium]|nr:antibiotic biosynthesis monooxygenase [Sphingomonadales bacterium]
MPVAIIGQFRMPPENMETARPLMRKVMEASRAEDGCVQYNYAEDVLDPGLIRVSEVWQSRDQLMTHARSEHMAAWGKERTALGLTGRDITIYETDAGTPL